MFTPHKNIHISIDSFSKRNRTSNNYFSTVFRLNDHSNSHRRHIWYMLLKKVIFTTFSIIVSHELFLRVLAQLSRSSSSSGYRFCHFFVSDNLLLFFRALSPGQWTFGRFQKSKSFCRKFSPSRNSTDRSQDSPFLTNCETIRITLLTGLSDSYCG